MHGFDSPAGCIPSAAWLKRLVCHGTGNLSEGRSTSHRSRPERLHVLCSHISSDVTQQLIDCLVSTLGRCKVIRLTWCHVKRKSLGDQSVQKIENMIMVEGIFVFQTWLLQSQLYFWDTSNNSVGFNCSSSLSTSLSLLLLPVSKVG